MFFRLTGENFRFPESQEDNLKFSPVSLKTRFCQKWNKYVSDFCENWTDRSGSTSPIDWWHFHQNPTNVFFILTKSAPVLVESIEISVKTSILISMSIYRAFEYRNIDIPPCVYLSRRRWSDCAIPDGVASHAGHRSSFWEFVAAFLFYLEPGSSFAGWPGEPSRTPGTATQPDSSGVCLEVPQVGLGPWVKHSRHVRVVN